MKVTAFQAVCPFEIGDKVYTKTGISLSENTLDCLCITETEHRITDIACVQYIKSGRIKFLYELDGSGRLVQLGNKKK